MAAEDSFARYQVKPNYPMSHGTAITGGTVDLPYITRAIFTTAGGTVEVIMADGTSLSFGSVPAATWLPIRARRVTVSPGAVALW